MITIKRIMSALNRHFEATAKARVHSVLLGMDRETLEELGYSYAAIRMGVSAWPWQIVPQYGASAESSALRQGEMQIVAGWLSEGAQNTPQAAVRQVSLAKHNRDAA